MDWEDVCVWFEEIGAQELDIDAQREKQFSGRDYDHMIQKPWKFAIEEVLVLPPYTSARLKH